MRNAIEIAALGKEAVEPPPWPFRSSRRSPPKSPRLTPRPRATCTGARPARTFSIPRSCSSCGRGRRAVVDLNRAIDAFVALAGKPSPHRRGGADAMQHAFRCRSDSSSRAMRPRSAARASGCGGCARRRWCCSSAAPPARLQRSATAASKSRNGSRRCSICRCRTRPGTPTATGSPRLPPPLRFSPAPAARSRATWRC